MDFLRQHQLTIMLFLSGICSILAFLSFFTGSIPKKRRHSLMLLEICAALILIMDHYAYIYRGDVSTLGWWMVRISNFSVFLLSLFLLHVFNLYLCDLYVNEGGLKKVPKRLIAVEAFFLIAVICLLIGAFSGVYYTFDEMNRYQRSKGFVLSYCFPGIILILQFSVIIQYYKRLDRKIRLPLLFFATIPVLATIAQFFTYGLSLQNIAMVGMTVLLYIFVLIDMNKRVEHANRLEIEVLKGERKDIRIMFDQTATALANAIDAKDEYTHGHSMRVAEYSQKIAIAAHKDEKFCTDIYYAGLLHDVGKIGVSRDIINKNGKLTPEEFAEIKRHPVIGRQILSSISKSPYLSIAANYHHERYDGHGYPEGLKGEDIPEIARIIAVADSYDAMTSKRSYRDPIPQQKVREEIVKGMGTQFDPAFAKIMLHLIDIDTDYNLKESEEVNDLSGKSEFQCEELRSSKSEGIVLNQNLTKINLTCRSEMGFAAKTSVPAFIIFDSLDGRVHETEDKKRDLLYMEYAMVSFDGKAECGTARNLKVDIREYSDAQNLNIIEELIKGVEYQVEAVKYKDHVLIRVESIFQVCEFIIALPDSSRFCYLAFTGRHCTLSKVEIRKEKEPVPETYIPRIAEEVSYINGPEGDIPSVQIDGWRSAATIGVPVKDSMIIKFHTMSLPTARLIWHCPFITLFYSDDGKVNGPNFKEFVLIRLDGENWELDDYATNTMLISKNENFEGWENWKKVNKAGMDVQLSIKREGSKIIVQTENAGIAVKCISILKDEIKDVYLSLTGDQCVLTNIRVS